MVIKTPKHFNLNWFCIIKNVMNKWSAFCITHDCIHFPPCELAAPPTASSWTITFSPAEITAEKGLCAVISCTFTHPDKIKPTAAMWFKCPTSDSCDENENIIFHSETPSKAQKRYKQRVSLLETDLTKKNCSVIINDIRKNDAGEYHFKLPSSYTYTKKVNITVSGTMTIITSYRDNLLL